MSNALVIHCRNPGEFIASVVEHHRGFPLPNREDDKTYLVFIGLEGEDELLEQITATDMGFFEMSRGDLEICGQYGDKETVKFPVQVWEDGQDVGISLHELGISRFPRRTRTRVPLAEEMDNRHYKRGEFCVSNLEGEAGPGTFQAVQGPPPIPQSQQGRNGGITVGSVGLKYHSTDQEVNEVGEIAGEQLVAWHSPLPVNHLGDLNEIGDDENEQNANRKRERGDDKHVASRRLTHQFPHPRDRSGEISGGHIVINNSQKKFDNLSQQQPDRCIVGGKAIFTVGSEEFPQSTEVGRLTPQGKTISPIQDGVSCPNWSPRFGPESAGDPGKVAKGEEGWRDELQEWDKITSDLWVEDRVAIVGEREDLERNKASPNALPLGHQSVPLVPIPPHRDEITPLAKPPHSSPNYTTDEVKPMKLEGEDETPAYPAKTLENLTSIEHVDIVYLEDLETLHGFLEAMMFSPAASTPNPPLLAIWGLVRAHYQTRYFGGEGIGETVARAVEATAKSGRFLVLGEGCIVADSADRKDEVQEKLWVDLEVPLLNVGSMNVGGTVIVGQILRRWCRFGDDLEDAVEDGGHGSDDNDDGRDENGAMGI